MSPEQPTTAQPREPAGGLPRSSSVGTTPGAVPEAAGDAGDAGDAGLLDVDEPDILAASPALPSSGPEAATFVGVLRRRDFRLLWLAQVLSQLADKFLVYTLLIVVFTLTGRSSTQSLVMLAYTLPSILLSAPAGVFADRHDKRNLMITTNLLRGSMLLLIPLILSTPRLGDTAAPLIVVTLAFSATGQFFAPAEAASIPFLVERDQIMLATSLFMTTVVATLIAGVPAATLTIRLLGDQAPFYLSAVLFGLASLALLMMRSRMRSAGRRHAPTHSVMAELREGIAILGGHPVLRLGMVQLTVALVVVFTMFALGPAYMTHILRSRPEDTYQLLMPATGGLVVAAVFLGRTGRRLSRATATWSAAVLAGLALVGTGYVPGAVVSHGGGLLIAPVLIGFGTCFGAALGALLIVAFTVLQESSDEASRGRIFGGVFTVMNAAVALPLLAAGQLADTLGVDRVCIGLGILLALWGLVCRTALWASVLRLDDPPDGRPAGPG